MWVKTEMSFGIQCKSGTDYPCCESNERNHTTGKFLGKGFLVGRKGGSSQNTVIYMCNQPSCGINGCLFFVPQNKKTEEKKMKKKQTAILAAVLVVLCVLAGVLYQNFKPATTEGSKEITVTVVHADQSEKDFTYNTDAEYLGEVLTEDGLIEGEQGDYGIFVHTVDGEKIDESKQQWWCLTKDGESVMTGLDLTPITDGDQFELTMMEGY